MVEDLFLWRRQAKALGRSKKHLQAIDRILDRAKESLDPILEISINDYGCLFQDRQSFINKAFELMTQEK